MTDEEIHNIYLHMSGKAEGLVEATGKADFPVLFARAILEYKGLTKDVQNMASKSTYKEQLETKDEPVMIDFATMQLAESVGLIGPASRTHNLHDAIQRFHDLICANATIKAAVAFSRTLEAKDEPVAWGMETDGVILDVICPDEHEREEGEYTIPLYTHPKEWVGLKDDDEIPWDGVDAKSFAKAIEAKLKEKNNG